MSTTDLRDGFLSVRLAPRSSGLRFDVWIGPRGRMQGAARIATPTAVVTTEDDPPQVVEGRLSAGGLAQIRRYIALNRPAILDHWYERADGVELARALKQLPRR